MSQQIIELPIGILIVIMIIVFIVPIIVIIDLFTKEQLPNTKEKVFKDSFEKKASSISPENASVVDLDYDNSKIPTPDSVKELPSFESEVDYSDKVNVNDNNSLKLNEVSEIKFKTIDYNPKDQLFPKESFAFPYVLFPNYGCIFKEPQVGRLGRKGFKEDEFKNYLSSIFCDYCTIEDNNYLSVGTEGIIYEPDFTLKAINEEKNILIDIEIDEPYEGTNDLSKRRATHYLESDLIRNYHFQNRGWIVIRFAEIQIHKNPLGCCFFIAKVISSVDNEYSIPDTLLKKNDLEPISRWSEFEAKSWSIEKYRENYLGIDKFTLSEKCLTYREPINSQKDLQFEIKIQSLISHPKSPIKFNNQTEINELLNTVSLVPFRKGNLWTLYSLIDGQCVDDIYTYAFYADNHLFKSQTIVLFKNNSCCLLDPQSGQPSKKCYDYIRSIETDREIIFIVTQKHKYGIIDNNCKSILNYDYEGIYCVWMAPEFGVNDRDYGNYETTKESFLKIKKNGKFGLFDTNSLSFTFPCQYDEILENSNEEYRLIKDDQMLLFDIMTKKIIPFKKNMKGEKKESLSEAGYLLRKNYVPTKDTLWDVKNDILLYNGEIVYKKPQSDLFIDGFYNGIGRLIRFECDDEGCGWETSFGYMDLYGNLYFED